MTADDAARPPIVVRDNRRVDASGSTRGTASGSAGKSAEPGSKPGKSAAPVANEAEMADMTIAPAETESQDPKLAQASAHGSTDTKD